MNSEKQASKTSMDARPQRSNFRIIGTMIGTVVGMFCFALFIMPPLYDVLCDITGLNGKYTEGRVSITDFQQTDAKGTQQEDSGNSSGTASDTAISPTVKVQFVADESTDVHWPFYPKTRSLTIEPGTIHQVFFRVENPKSTAVIAQAIPSITPAQASLYLKKTQCFCFNHQPLAPFEGKDMGLVFYVDPEIPDELRELTLSYRLYDITDRIDTPADSNNADKVTTNNVIPNTPPQPAQQPATQSAQGDTPNV